MVVGVSEDLIQLKSRLTARASKLDIIPIVGMGGTVSVTGKPPVHEEYKDLIVKLHKALFSRRYMIVLDDIWSCKAWDEVQMAFPEDNRGSRIVLTTRENYVADHVNSNSHQMRLIDMDSSWELLRNKVFGKESCPTELEEVGKRIAINCGGLPLALQVIGGLLSRSEISKYFWAHVEHNVLFQKTIRLKPQNTSGCGSRRVSYI